MDPRAQIAAWHLRRRIAREVRPAAWARFGEGTFVSPPLTLDRPGGASIGDSSYLLMGASFALGPAGRVSIGSRTYLGRDLTVVALEAVEIGDDVMGSDRLLFADTAPAPTRGGVPVVEQELAPPRPVRIEDGVFLGTGAMVLAGVTVGARSFVGAGAVVTRSVPPNCVVVGNPARVVRQYDAERGAWVDGAP